MFINTYGKLSIAEQIPPATTMIGRERTIPKKTNRKWVLKIRNLKKMSEKSHMNMIERRSPFSRRLK